MLLNFSLIFFLIALNGFFVSVEFAVVAARKARLETLAMPDSRAAAIVRTWLESPAARDRLIAAAQLGITIVSLALGAVGDRTFEALLAPLFHDLALPPALALVKRVLPVVPLAASLTLVTILHVVFGEQVPKVAALHAPERFALLAAQPMYLFARTFHWFVVALDWATQMVLRLLGLDTSQVSHGTVYTLEELKQIVAESGEVGVIPAEGGEILHAVLDFGELVVRQVMVPRTEIIALRAETPLREVLRLAAQHGVTKFPVYGRDLDDILGILHIKDLLRHLEDPAFERLTAQEFAREALFVPETLPVNALLVQFRERKQHIAIVIDEYGGTAGLVTLEDLIEEIVGDIEDFFDRSAGPAIQPLPDGSVLIDGLTLIEDVNGKLGLHLEDPNYDTIAGYVLGRLGHIPKTGEAVELADGRRLRVLAMDGLRIAKLRLEQAVHPQNEPEEAQAEG
ncbi:MAG TPA: HlyC/CorC family transporter [Anaerolineales bacterium]|nr:HlyC/CorC family transporter [Anaerolineales bacterium]